MNHNKNRYLIITILISCLFLAYLKPATAAERKKPNWLASCPEVVDATPELSTPKTVLLRVPSGNEFKLLAKDSTDFVSEPQSIIGCYVLEELVTDSNQSPQWQIGSLSRDLNGYYFKNAANHIWRLILKTQDNGRLVLETPNQTVYHKKGETFRLDFLPQRAVDCKVKDYAEGGGRLGFPRNSARVPQLGITKNLILVVDFPDAVLTESLDSVVENVVAPKVVENFYFQSSNGKLRPTFTTFPQVIRLNSLEKSFAPNSSGGFFVDGVMQDHRLVREAIAIAKTQGSLDGYSSINVFAPTANSMGYYGSAYLDLPLDVGNKTVYNSQLVGGTIGTVKSLPPSWKVFAHEYGHLLGMYDYYIPGTSSSGKSPGPFDFMGNTSGTANSFFGFQRWVQGWFEDNDVDCDFTPTSSVTHTLSPLNQVSGKRLYVHPLDGTTALAVEFRTESEFDFLKGNDGLLVYLIDMKVVGLKGPISIQPSEQDLVLNPRDDVERYSTAPLSTGQFVKVKDLVIVADTVGKDQASFRVFTKAEFLVKQEVEAKAAADLKAKQEADAKAAADKSAAELKAKLEADAKAAAEKAAAELKAKQEADAKAAAELKAKQEADAKAAAELKAKQDAAADKAALAKAQSELAAANAALADAQKVNREQAARITSFEEQFKVLSESVATVQNQLSQLNSKLVAALSGLNTANAKIKKICAAKPKPKGC
jgi:M6 family metalloprotease-like protein